MALVGVNAARRYERSMLYHTKGALDAGSTVAELAEILLPCILRAAFLAWLEGSQHFVYAEEYVGDRTAARARTRSPRRSPLWKRRRLLSRRSRRTGTRVGAIDEEVCAGNAARLRQPGSLALATAAQMKELVLVGINLSERYPSGASLYT